MSDTLFTEKRFTWKGSLIAGYVIAVYFSILAHAIPGLFIASLVFFSGLVYVWKLKRDKTIYTLTPESLIIQRGILNTTMQKIPVAKIQNIILREGFIQKQFNTGNLIVESAGENSATLIQDILDPRHKMEQILDIVHSKQKTS